MHTTRLTRMSGTAHAISARLAERLRCYGAGAAIRLAIAIVRLTLRSHRSGLLTRDEMRRALNASTWLGRISWRLVGRPHDAAARERGERPARGVTSSKPGEHRM